VDCCVGSGSGGSGSGGSGSGGSGSGGSGSGGGIVSGCCPGGGKIPKRLCGVISAPGCCVNGQTFEIDANALGIWLGYFDSASCCPDAPYNCRTYVRFQCVDDVDGKALYIAMSCGPNGPWAGRLGPDIVNCDANPADFRVEFHDLLIPNYLKPCLTGNKPCSAFSVILLPC
jgi:hypothetical protein